MTNSEIQVVLDMFSKEFLLLRDDPQHQQEFLLDYAKVLTGLANVAAGVACPNCSGTGEKCYANTATWRGGMGGASLTNDVCDHCWGTGRTDRTGPDLRAMVNAVANANQGASSEWLAQKLGVNLKIQGERLGVLADKLRKMRFGDDFWLHRAADILADTLDDLIDAARRTKP